MQLLKRKDLEGSWTEQVPKLVNKWNKMKNTTTSLTPIEAHKDENALDTRMAISLTATHDRKYPELKVGDKVRIKKKKGKLDKESTPFWSEETYTISTISHGSAYALTDKKMSSNTESYALTGVDGYFMRHELLKV